MKFVVVWVYNVFKIRFRSHDVHIHVRMGKCV